MNGVVFYIPEATAATPIDGECIVNAWWAVHPERGLAFYMTKRRPWELEPGEVDHPSPQCNRDKFTAEALHKKLYPDHEARQIPVVFMEHATREMHRLRKQFADEHAKNHATVT